MSRWPETATCVAVTLRGDSVHLVACHGLDDLVGMVVRPSPAFDDAAGRSTVRRRVETKGWLDRWAGLRLEIWRSRAERWKGPSRDVLFLAAGCRSPDRDHGLQRLELPAGADAPDRRHRLPWGFHGKNSWNCSATRPAMLSASRDPSTSMTGMLSPLAFRTASSAITRSRAIRLR